MYSINAKVLNFILKYITKPIQGPMPITPAVMRGLRSGLEVASRMVFRTPSCISLTSVQKEGVNGEWLVADTVVDHSRAILYLHGGGYFFGSPFTHRPLTWRISRKSRTRVFSLDYRLVPEHVVADCCADAVAAYRWLLQQGYAPEKLVIGGDSAGGGLTLLTLLALKKQGLPQPRAAFCLSPFADMTQTSPSLISNARSSHMFHANALKRMEQYLTEETGDARDPSISPLFGDYAGLPPLFFQVADTELLFYDTLLTARNAMSAGVEVELDIWHDLPHVFTIFSDVLPEGKQGIRNIADFILSRCAPA